MKKNFFKLALCFAALLAVALASCSNSSNSGGNPEWTVVTNMNDLVGTWVYSASTQGLNETDTYTVGADYSTSVKLVADYSAASPLVESVIQIVVASLKASGYSCVNDSSTKKITATRSFTSTEFKTFVLGGGVMINAAKNKAMMKDVQGNAAIFTKQ